VIHNRSQSEINGNHELNTNNNKSKREKNPSTEINKFDKIKRKVSREFKIKAEKRPSTRLNPEYLEADMINQRAASWKKTKTFSKQFKTFIEESISNLNEIDEPPIEFKTKDYPRRLSRYRLLGRSGLRVSPLCLGTMNFGTKWSFMGEMTKSEAEKIFDLYVQEGGNFIDTANKFQEGESEEWLGEWIEERGIREEIVIASKYSLPITSRSINSGGNHRKSLLQAINGTLRRLRTDYIDLYYVHFWDFTTPPDELMQTLNDLVRCGKVLYIGISDCPAWQVAQLNTIAELRGWTRFIAYQGKYNCLERDLEREVIPMSIALGLGVVPWGIFGFGKLTGKYNTQEEGPTQSKRREGIKLTDQEIFFLEVVTEISKQVHKTPAQVVLNWVLLQSGILSPVIGCRTVQQLEDNIAALQFELSQEQIDKIKEASKFSIGFPHNFIGTSFYNSPWIKTAGIIDF